MIALTANIDRPAGLGLVIICAVVFFCLLAFIVGLAFSKAAGRPRPPMPADRVRRNGGRR